MYSPHRAERLHSRAFLHRLDPEDDPLTATEAAAEGPWQAVPLPGADPAEPWTVSRAPQPYGGDATAGTFAHQATARLLAAALPLAARDGTYRLAAEPDAAGFPLLLGSRAVAHLPWYHDELVATLNVLDKVRASSRSLGPSFSCAYDLRFGCRCSRLVRHLLSMDRDHFMALTGRKSRLHGPEFSVRARVGWLSSDPRDRAPEIPWPEHRHARIGLVGPVGGALTEASLAALVVPACQLNPLALALDLRAPISGGMMRA